MNRLLASVADVFEAELACACGVDWIDVKDPWSGALGAPSVAVVRDVVRVVAGRLPVSATGGDTWFRPDTIVEQARRLLDTGASHVKVALAARDLQDAALEALSRAVTLGLPVIVVCMAERPPQAEDLRQLAACGVAGVMLDTADKAGPPLSGLLPWCELAAFVAQARGLGLQSGLAGRLRFEDVAPLAACGADYLGFRSALCSGGEREQHLARAPTAAVVAALAECRAAMTTMGNAG